MFYLIVFVWRLLGSSCSSLSRLAALPPFIIQTERTLIKRGSNIAFVAHKFVWPQGQSKTHHTQHEYVNVVQRTFFYLLSARAPALRTWVLAQT